MSDDSASSPNKVVPGHQNLTPNERAVIERIRLPLLRSIFTAVWRVKLSLQFSGWLQYLPPTLIVVLVWLIAGVVSLFGGRIAATAIAAIGLVFLLELLTELITVKLRLRPQEHRPKRNDDLDLFDLMRARRSCRSFQTRKLSDEDRRELLRAVGRHTRETGIGTSPVRFEYLSAPVTVWPTVNASEFLVAIAPKEYDRLAVIDVGRSLQKIVMDAVRMGLGTCWIGPGADHESITYHLGERFSEERDHIICVCAVGYRSRFIPVFIRFFNAQMGHRLPLSSLFFTDPGLTHPIEPNARPYDRFGRTFEICQWAPSSYNGQTTRCAAVIDRNENGAKATRFDFFSSIESRYYAPVAAGIWCANWELGCAALGIEGRFEVLSNEERGVGGPVDDGRLPRYEVSWILA